MVLYKHDKTGAQLMSVVNSDENKTFGVTFRQGPWAKGHAATLAGSNERLPAPRKAHLHAHLPRGADRQLRRDRALGAVLAMAAMRERPPAAPGSTHPCRTPVANSRGVPHILEHSVLCGSRKYPIKVGWCVWGGWGLGVGGSSGAATASLRDAARLRPMPWPGCCMQPGLGASQSMALPGLPSGMLQAPEAQRRHAWLPPAHAKCRSRLWS